MTTKHAVQAPHVGRAVRNCRCAQCTVHRFLDRQAAQDAKTAALCEGLFRYAPLRSVRVGSTCGPELRERINGGR